MADLQVALKNNAMLGSLAHGYAMPDSVKSAVWDVITKAFNDPSVSSADSVKQLVEAVENSK